MKQEDKKKESAPYPRYESDLSSLKGTFAVEGITLSQDTIANIERIARGQASCQQILQELHTKYDRKG